MRSDFASCAPRINNAFLTPFTPGFVHRSERRAVDEAWISHIDGNEFTFTSVFAFKWMGTVVCSRACCFDHYLFTTRSVLIDSSTACSRQISKPEIDQPDQEPNRLGSFQDEHPCSAPLSCGRLFLASTAIVGNQLLTASIATTLMATTLSPYTASTWSPSLNQRRETAKAGTKPPTARFNIRKQQSVGPVA